MKNQEKKEKFIELRSKGLSYSTIAQELNISKPTLIKWNQEFSKEVSNLLYLHVEGLLEKYKLCKIHRIEILAKSLTDAFDELAKRNFTEMSTKDLINLTLTLERSLKKEMKSIQYHTGNEIDLFADFAEATENLPY